MKTTTTILFICLIFLGASLGFAQDGSVEVTNASIDPQPQEGQGENGNMALSIGLKNNDHRKVENASLEISYYAKDGVLIQKNIIKKALSESIPAKEERKYRIHLNRYNKALFGSLDTKSQGQYPYSRAKEVEGLRVKVMDVNWSW
ncbi:MAG: hypothetical protein WCJ71_10730 [Candidatus Omnitrophota bacterium]